MLKKYLVPPVAIYAVIFLFISALIGAKIDQTATWVWLVSLVILIIGLYLGANYAKPKSAGEGLKYSLAWVIVLLVLDIILTVPFTGWEYFSKWQSYVSYVLTLLIPALLNKKE